MIRALLLDFDGTLVTHDMLDVVCGIAGKEEESHQIQKAFIDSGVRSIAPLMERIKLLKGVSEDQITAAVKADLHLMPGARELIAYAKSHNIVTLLASGNIEPVLRIYQEELGIDHIIGTKPVIENGVVVGIAENAWPSTNFKAEGLQNKLTELGIDPRDTIVIGDSRVDAGMFELAGHSIAINPKEAIKHLVDYVIRDSLANAIPIVEELMKSITNVSF